MDGGHRRFVKEHAAHSGDSQMVAQVVLHGLLLDPLEVAAGYHAGGQGLAVAVLEVVDQVGLPGQHDGQIGFGILFQLGQGVQFGKDLQAQQGSLVDHQRHFHLFAVNQLQNLLFDSAGHHRPGSGPMAASAPG